MEIPDAIQSMYQNSRCLYSVQDIEKALDVMAKQIKATLADKDPILLCVMVGGVVLSGNLLPRLDFPLSLDYIHATRYKGEIEASEMDWRATPSQDLKGRTVLVLDDILDSGLTLAEITKYCQAQGAKEVLHAVLIDKKCQRDPKGIQTADFAALKVENKFIFGYGLDYKEYLRNAPGIFEVLA